MSDKEKAISLLEKNTSYKREDILKIKEIHKGYTNLSFLFILKDKTKLQIRLGQNNKIVNRKNEITIINALPEKLFLYVDENGNAIKKWIIGYNPKFIFKKKKLLSLFCDEIKKLHALKINNLNILKHNYLEFFDEKIKNEYVVYSQKYFELINKYKDLPLIFSHNDTNPWNIIYSWKESKIYLIDFEWSRINNDYWDYVNFFRETSLNIKWLKYMCDYVNIDFNLAKEFLFICTFFALQWSFKVDETEKLLKYRKRVLKKLKKYWKLLN